MPKDGTNDSRKRFKPYQIGYLHIVSCGLRHGGRKLILFLAIDRVSNEHGVDHRLTKPCHPWTSGQAERMNRTVKDATVKTSTTPISKA